MQIFLDTADIKEIKKWNQTGLIDGVTTNPSHLSKAGGHPREVIKKIVQLLPEGIISVEVTESEPKKVYDQAVKISKLHKNIAVKVPCHIDYYDVINRLVENGIRLNITLVFSVVQGFFMSKLGVAYISPFVGRLKDNDIKGNSILYEMREMIDNYSFNTAILAASIRSTRDIHHAILAGVDCLTLPADVLEKATEHVLTDQGIAKFAADWKKLGISKFP